jgi:hypothetical protein
MKADTRVTLQTGCFQHKRTIDVGLYDAALNNGRHHGTLAGSF